MLSPPSASWKRVGTNYSSRRCIHPESEGLFDALISIYFIIQCTHNSWYLLHNKWPTTETMKTISIITGGVIGALGKKLANLKHLSTVRRTLWVQIALSVVVVILSAIGSPAAITSPTHTFLTVFLPIFFAPLQVGPVEGALAIGVFAAPTTTPLKVTVFEGQISRVVHILSIQGLAFSTTFQSRRRWHLWLLRWRTVVGVCQCHLGNVFDELLQLFNSLVFCHYLLFEDRQFRHDHPLHFAMLALIGYFAGLHVNYPLMLSYTKYYK